ncbi:hypothetical protein MNV49_006822 [Pseudohyphozyma bogoriensis]|nr:hypothetical protein MNV49_006822 [Pseudohyphozyma bogoriensis]
MDWNQVKGDWGASFAYVKATEGLTFGLLRGAYHFALPPESSGADQATYFVAHGGGWTADGKTLPGTLDIEYNPYTDDDGTNSCYGFSKSEMTDWCADFIATYTKLTSRPPMIYTTRDWWVACTGDATDFGDTVPLWQAGDTSPPSGWKYYTFLQSSLHDMDWNTFNGDGDALVSPAPSSTSTATSTSTSESVLDSNKFYFVAMGVVLAVAAILGLAVACCFSRTVRQKKTVYIRDGGGVSKEESTDASDEEKMPLKRKVAGSSDQA